MDIDLKVIKKAFEKTFNELNINCEVETYDNVIDIAVPMKETCETTRTLIHAVVKDLSSPVKFGFGTNNDGSKMIYRYKYKLN